MAYWVEKYIYQPVNEMANQQLPPTEQLRFLVGAATDGNAALEKAMRAWGLNSPKVQALLAKADLEAMAILKDILVSLEVPASLAQVRAQILYSGYVGQMMLGNTLEEPVRDQLIDQLLAWATRLDFSS